jgi:Flp pilus assembly protein TadD
MTLSSDQSSDPLPAGSSPAAVAEPTAERARTAAEQMLERADALALGPLPVTAVAVYRTLLASEPGQVEARLHLAALLERLDEPGEAIEVLSDGLKLTPDQTEFLVLRGGIQGRLRRYPDAEADLRRALRLHPSHAPAHFELAHLLWRKGLIADSALHFRRSLEFQPDNPRTHYYLGEALNQAGDLAGAESSVARALELDPQDAKAHHLLGRILDRLGRPDEARDMYCRGRELGES